MNKGTVSIIVPIYQVEKYLRSCVNSICNQTYHQLEIILVDDGSPDGCGSICDEYAKSDPRIAVIHKMNGGLSSARNAGLDIATGKYVAFIDADDTIHPQYIEILVELCEKYECDIAQCDFLTVSEQSSKLPLNPQQALIFYSGKQALHALCTGGGVKYTVVWNKIYRRDLFQDIRYPLGRIHEDESTTYKILWKAGKMAITNQYLYYYLQRPDSIMGKSYSVKRLDALEAFKERLSFLKEKKLDEEYFATMRTYIGLLERSCALVRENIENGEVICAALLKEKQQLEEQFPSLLSLEEQAFRLRWTIDTCPYPENAKLVLYGAGKCGRTCYQWVRENQWGIIAGWVDNLWGVIENTGYPVTPLDSILSMSYDYILVAVQGRDVQEEIIQNLRCWGISEEKILTI